MKDLLHQLPTPPASIVSGQLYQCLPATGTLCTLPLFHHFNHLETYHQLHLVHHTTKGGRYYPQEAMAEEQPPAEEYELVDIVQKPLGDMVMRVGNKESGTGNVRVHKSVMRMASPVFETMLGGEFAEATRTLDENDPLELEDNRELLIVMCQVLHHQNHDAAAAAVILSKIIVVADKYNCLAGVLLGIMTPLRTQIPDLRQRLNVAKSVLLGNLMCGAYLAGDGFLLWQFSRVIAAQMKPATADKVFSCDEVLLKIIPSNLPGKYPPRHRES